MGAPEELARLRAALATPGRDTSDYDLNPGFLLPEGRALRAAGVLIALIETRGTLHVVLTKRASGLKHHPGQIALPGGKVDPTDRDARSAALRESHEEVGLDPRAVRIIGEMPAHETVTGYLVTPIVGLVTGPYIPVPEAGEVDEVFTVPLSHVTDHAMFRVERRRWLGQERRYYTVPYGPHYIWGATARIFRALADRMAGK